MSVGHGQVETPYSPSAWQKAEVLGVSLSQYRPQLHSILARLLLCLLLTILTTAGCARLPAIDPNGQSIFLPYPASTQVTVPQIHAGNGNPGIIPQDAFPTPLDPPPCLDGSCAEPGGIHNLFNHKKKKAAIANHFAKKDPGKCGEIQLSPLRIVAPVNGEVLLLAGICGKDGYLLKREPLEWMLAPGSVGQFIEVGDDAKGKLCSVFGSGPKVEKLGVDFARGRTSAKETLLTKGTPGCADDLEVAEGQTWLSVSSPNEGVSRVTVLAPESELWDRRRQTATIYWVDSQANFPEPVRLDATKSAILSTRVTRSESLVPAERWKVRYTIVDPNLIAFLRSDGTPETQTNIFVAETNADGIATVAVSPRGPNGVTPVHIEVIKPASPDDSLPELVLHQADTFVTVSSAGLVVNASGPPAAAVGEIVEYVATMANPGDLTAENARLQVLLPAGTTFKDAFPQPSARTPTSLEWEQGPLAAGQELKVTLLLQLDAPQDINVQFRGLANGFEKLAAAQTRVIAPSVDVSFLPATENTTGQAEVGETVFYQVGVRNTGTQTLVNVEVLINTSEGWLESNQNSRTVRRIIPMLQPGQSDVSDLALRVIQQGQHTSQVTVKSAGGAVMRESSPVGIVGVARRERTPRMEASIRTDPATQAAVSQVVVGYFTVQNKGETPLSDLDVTIRHDAALRADKVDGENRIRMQQIDATTLRWKAPSLQPGQMAQMAVTFIPTAPVTQANFAMNVVNGQLTTNATHQIQIIGTAPSGSVLPPGAGAGPAQPTAPTQRTGNWEVIVEALQNPTVVGTQSRYGVQIQNAQNLQDNNVRIELGIPEGVDFNAVVDFEGQTIQPSQTERGVYLLPIYKYVRPNDRLRFTIIVTPRTVQEMSLSVGVSSDAFPQRQIVRRSITVNARP